MELKAINLDIFHLLKQRTALVHQRVEDTILVFRPDFSLPDYVQLLERFYGFWAPVEQRLSCISALREAELRLDTRLKSTLIEHDLEYFKRRPLDVPFCAALPAIDNLSQAMGCLYVLEGSTLGARFISKQIEKQLHLTTGAGASFFNAYGESTGQQWNAFRQFVGARTSSDNSDEVLKAAQQTFECLLAWMNAG